MRSEQEREPLTDVFDLLDDEARSRLRDDLAEMAQLRVRAAAEARQVILGG